MCGILTSTDSGPHPQTLPGMVQGFMVDQPHGWTDGPHVPQQLLHPLHITSQAYVK